jgi:dihydrodipicolinate synthase/N-acetylneuraminate lyase
VIESGSYGLVMNAVASEAHAMSDSEQAKVTEFNFQRVANRVPVVLTVTHYSVEVAAEKARRAEGLVAACVMSMPPFFGRWTTDVAGALGYFWTICSAASGPVMVQDHEISGLTMGPDFLAKQAREFQNLRYFKIEVTQSPWKIEKVLQAAGEYVDGIFGAPEVDSPSMNTNAGPLCHACLLDARGLYESLRPARSRRIQPGGRVLLSLPAIAPIRSAQSRPLPLESHSEAPWRDQLREDSRSHSGALR